MIAADGRSCPEQLLLVRHTIERTTEGADAGEAERHPDGPAVAMSAGRPNPPKGDFVLRAMFCQIFARPH